MKKILVPTDFSDISYNAALYALHLAEKLRAELYFLNVFHVPVIDPNMPPEMVDDMIEEARKSARKDLDEFKRKINGELSQMGLVAHFEMKMGFVVEEILLAAKEKDIKMIVMGTLGASGIKKILGSNTALVIEKCKRPVLAVPAEAKYHPIQNIVYATDLKTDDYLYIDQLLRLCTQLSARLTLLHVSKPGEEPDSKRLEDIKIYFWRELAMENIQLEIIENETVESGIEYYIKNHPVDILAMLKHRKNIIERILHPSMTKRMAFHPLVPVLVFHE